MLPRLANLFGLVVFSTSLGAFAADAPARVSLRWNAPDACPDDSEAVRNVEGFLGQRLSESREQQLGVSVDVQGTAHGFSAKLVFASPRGAEQRNLEHPDCSKLMEAAALLVALAIDPERVQARQDTARASDDVLARDGKAAPEPATAAPEPPAAPPPAAPLPPAFGPAPLRPKALRSSLRPTMAMSAFAGRGPLPTLAPGFTGELGLRYAWFRATAIGCYWAPANAGIEGLPGSSVRLTLASAGARACGVRRAGAWAVGGCLGADLSQLSGSGEGVDNARTRSEAFASMSLGANLAYVRTALAPLLGVELSRTLSRPRFGVLEGDREHDAFQPAPWGLLASLGLALGL